VCEIIDNYFFEYFYQEMEQVQQQDKIHQENLHDKQVLHQFICKFSLQTLSKINYLMYYENHG